MSHVLYCIHSYWFWSLHGRAPFGISIKFIFSQLCDVANADTPTSPHQKPAALIENE